MASLGVFASAHIRYAQRWCLSHGLKEPVPIKPSCAPSCTRSKTRLLFRVNAYPHAQIRFSATGPAHNTTNNSRFKSWKRTVFHNNKEKVGHFLSVARIAITAAPLYPDLSQDTPEKPDDTSDLDDATVLHAKENQVKTPWQREGSQNPPVRRERSASVMTKGKLLTTPSRLLKLVLPITTADSNGDRKNVEPLALLLHPQQPLSYLERLIQAEVPPIKHRSGKMHPPSVNFLAVDSRDETIHPKGSANGDLAVDVSENEQAAQAKQEDKSRLMSDTKESQTLGSRKISYEDAANLELEERDNKQTTVTTSSAAASSRRTPTPLFVRWSSSTEIGDFIRDASRVKEFQVEIENSPLGRIPVAVPSFNDRTYYLRMRLRKLSKKLKSLAIIKQECDILAQRGAQRVALGGLGVMVSWWYIVYKLTFETDYGWDTMEPITYLVSLSTLMGGYTWFLYHNREISYRSALDFTVSRRQQKLYQARGIDLQVWEALVDEANVLRREIKTVADEYEVEWDERADEEDERVTEALKHERRQKERKEKDQKQGKDDHGEEGDKD